MEQMNFFEAFGLGSEDDFFGSARTEKPSAKKAEKKASAKTAGKENASAKTGADFEVKLPVMVKARSFQVDALAIGEASSAKASEVWGELEKTYPQFAMGAFELAYIKELNCIFVCDGRLAKTSSGVSVFENADAIVRICDGETVCELTPGEWPDVDPEEVTLGEVCERFVKANPSYDGCGLYFEVKAGAAYPVFEKAVSAKAGEIMEVIICGSRQAFEVAAGESLAVKAGGTVKGVTPYVCAPRAGADGSLSYRVGGRGAQVYSKQGGATACVAKQAEKKYPLPMPLLVANFNQTYELSSDMFEGKEKVTKAEITAGMAKVEPLFGDSDRKIEYLYNEGKNIMSCMFVSGKKGAGA